jgi:hypothetical protein
MSIAHRVALAALPALLIAGPASAGRSPHHPGPDHDTRPCVSKIEIHAVDVMKPHTRYELETRWEVGGLGQHKHLVILGRAVIYPRCGMVNQFPDKFYAVVYGRRPGGAQVLEELVFQYIENDPNNIVW